MNGYPPEQQDDLFFLIGVFILLFVISPLILMYLYWS